jgi:hypothetical protein
VRGLCERSHPYYAAFADTLEQWFAEFGSSALMSKEVLSRAAILGYIAGPRSSIIGKLASRGTPSPDTAADAVKRPVALGTDMRTYLSRLR